MGPAITHMWWTFLFLSSYDRWSLFLIYKKSESILFYIYTLLFRWWGTNALNLKMHHSDDATWKKKLQLWKWQNAKTNGKSLAFVFTSYLSSSSHIQGPVFNVDVCITYSNCITWFVLQYCVSCTIKKTVKCNVIKIPNNI